ncbi:MAG: 30S ribosomal protein S16 [Acidobacteriota bacterium]
MLRIRLARRGATHRPLYRFVVSDSRKNPTATPVDTLGFFDPKGKPSQFKLDLERARSWIRKGAIPSARVRAFIKKASRADG